MVSQLCRTGIDQLTDYSRVEIQGVRYKFVNLGAATIPHQFCGVVPAGGSCGALPRRDKSGRGQTVKMLKGGGRAAPGRPPSPRACRFSLRGRRVQLLGSAFVARDRSNTPADGARRASIPRSVPLHHVQPRKQGASRWGQTLVRLRAARTISQTRHRVPRTSGVAGDKQRPVEGFMPSSTCATPWPGQ